MAVFRSVAGPAVSSVPSAEVLTDSTQIHFPLSSSRLDLDLDGNGEQLGRMLGHLDKISGQDSIYVISSLRVIGSASPVGSETINRRLSEERAQALFDYFGRRVSLPDSLTHFEYIGRNWSGLYNMVAADPVVPSRAKILALLRPAAEGTSLSTEESDRLLQRLKELDGGGPYDYVYRRFFPALQYSNLWISYEKRPVQEIVKPAAKAIVAPVEPLPDDVSGVTVDIGELEAVVSADTVPQPGPEPAPLKPFRMDLRTNMLFDVVAVPNIGAEFYLGGNFSVLANWMYGWWSSNPRHRYWRIYGGELGARWWFGRNSEANPLTGHHVGIYGGVLIFDFEWGGTGYMGGKPGGTLWDRCLVNSGIEYGYSLPIGRNLNIDFSIGLGYLTGNYIKYFPFDNDYYREKEYKMRFFGPTKAEISLVWLLGRGNVNNRKGGER